MSIQGSNYQKLHLRLQLIFPLQMVKETGHYFSSCTELATKYFVIRENEVQSLLSIMAILTLPFVTRVDCFGVDLKRKNNLTFLGLWEYLVRFNLQF